MRFVALRRGEGRKLHIFMLHGQLRDYGGHTYAETVGFIEAFARRGHKLSLFCTLDAHPDIVAETGARPLYGFDDADLARFPGAGDRSDPAAAELEGFLRTSQMVRRCCHAMTDLTGAWPDVVTMPWARAWDIEGVADWLADLPPARRPKVVLNIIRPEDGWAIDDERREVSGDFSYFRVASRRVAALAPAGGLALTSVEPRMCRLIGALSGLDCPPAPMQKHFPDAAQLLAWGSQRDEAAPTVSLMGPMRWEKGGELLAEVVAAVCAARPDTHVFVQLADRQSAERLSADLRSRGGPVKITIQLGALPPEDYWRRLLASDLLLMPYVGAAYALMPSGPFAEAVVSEIPVVAPKNTWMGDRLAEGWGAGDTFETATASLIAEATLRALERLPQLRAKAAGQGEAWRKAHGADAYVAHVFRRLGLEPG